MTEEVEILKNELGVLEHKRTQINDEISSKQLEIMKLEYPWEEGDWIANTTETRKFAGFRKNRWGWEIMAYKIKVDGEPHKNPTQIWSYEKWHRM